jgi:N-acetylmuramoyl-L-alanine amidase
MRTIRRIMVHCSDSTFGDAALIESWHIQRGWSEIGYHYVLLRDGTVEQGNRHDDEVGAHVKGHNHDSIGICLIGKDGLFSMAQAASLRQLLQALRAQYAIPSEQIFGHSQFDKGKTCPDFDVQDFVERVGV